MTNPIKFTRRGLGKSALAGATLLTLSLSRLLLKVGAELEYFLVRRTPDGTISPAETTVAVLTGHGLKASEKIGELLGN